MEIIDEKLFFYYSKEAVDEIAEKLALLICNNAIEPSLAYKVLKIDNDDMIRDLEGSEYFKKKIIEFKKELDKKDKIQIIRDQNTELYNYFNNELVRSMINKEIKPNEMVNAMKLIKEVSSIPDKTNSNSTGIIVNLQLGSAEKDKVKLTTSKELDIIDVDYKE